MGIILQTTSSNSFSSMKTILLWIRFHWYLFPKAQLRWVTTKKQKWCHFLENLQKYSRKYMGFIHAKQMGGYHAWFWDIWVQFRHEMIRKSPIITHSPKWVIICGFVSYFMCNIGQNISKTSMVTHNLFCIDETNVLQGIFMQIFKKFTSLLFFCSDPP